MGETPLVVMVWGAVIRLPLSRRHEAAVERGSRSLLRLSGIASSRALPTSSAGYWSPKVSLFGMQAPPERRVPPEAIFFRPGRAPSALAASTGTCIQLLRPVGR